MHCQSSYYCCGVPHLISTSKFADENEMFSFTSGDTTVIKYIGKLDTTVINYIVKLKSLDVPVEFPH